MSVVDHLTPFAPPVALSLVVALLFALHRSSTWPTRTLHKLVKQLEIPRTTTQAMREPALAHHVTQTLAQEYRMLAKWCDDLLFYVTPATDNRGLVSRVRKLDDQGASVKTVAELAQLVVDFKVILKKEGKAKEHRELAARVKTLTKRLTLLARIRRRL